MLKNPMANSDMADENKTIKVKTPDIQKVRNNIPVSNGFLVQVKRLTIRTHTGTNLLSEISFQIDAGKFVSLAGPSHSGKSALLYNLAGLMKPSNGEVFINGVDLYANLKTFRSSVGFVPAEFAWQEDLTVAEIMMDGARLRLPSGDPSLDPDQRVQILLETVGLTHVIDSHIGSLSKVEKRRLSIAVELIAYPGLLLIDKSSESLTPFEETQISMLLRDLSRHGLTVIQVNDLSKPVELSDKIIFLAPGGVLAWFGPVNEAYNYFRSLIPAGTAKEAEIGPEDAIEVLANQQFGDGSDWAKRFKDQPAYQKYVDDPLNNKLPDLVLLSQPLMRVRNLSKGKLPPTNVPQASDVQKLFLLINRNYRLLWREKTWRLMLALPPLIALVDFILSSPTMLDPLHGDPSRPPIIFGLIVFLDLLIAALLVQNEILKDRAVYQRENRTASLSVPYIFSKLWLVGILAVYQGAVWSIFHFVATGMAGGLILLPIYGITLFLIAFLGGILGLMASTLSRTPWMISGLVLLLTIPQLILSGSIVPLPHLNSPIIFLSGLDPSRYAFESMVTASGYGRAVSNDPCWKMPADQRIVLTDQQKQVCTCMGINIFSTCNFPGIQAYYSFVIEQPMPAQPVANDTINNIPAQPLLRQGETLDQFSAEVKNYTSEMEIYQGNYSAFLVSVNQYADALANWQRQRSIAIGYAEGVIADAIDHYGQGFNVNVLEHWSILIIMALCLIILLVGFQLRTGRVRI